MDSNTIISLVKMLLIPFIAVLVPILIGQRYGFYIKKKHLGLHETPVGSFAGAAMGLLAFMLAFTFQISSGHYDARKKLLLEEVTAIRSTYLRAGLIQEPFRSEARKMIIKYVDLRVDLAENPSKLKNAIEQSQKILNKFWIQAETLAEQDRNSEIYTFYINSINALVDLQNQRISVAIEYHIPKTVLWVLFIITFLSMLMLGFQFGVTGKGHFAINFTLASIFAMVMFLILALDHAESGLVKVDQQPMLRLQHQIYEMHKK